MAAVFIILIIFLAILVVLVAWILIAPIVFYLNTDRMYASARISGLIKAEAEWAGQKPKITIELFFFNIPLPKTKASKAEINEPEKIKKKKNHFKIKPGIIIKYTKAFFKSFYIKIFRLKLDTGDYLVNAWLYPVFCMIRDDGQISCSVNFDDELSLEMMVTNRMGRLAWIGMKMWLEMRK